MDRNNKPLLCIGHRGAMGYAPENTLMSFHKALEMGVHCIELDVYFVDGQLVVFHDDELERTTNGEGNIQDKTFEYLRALDCGEGEQIPTLEEVVQLINQRAGVNIELKGLGTAKPVMEYIQKMRTDGWRDDLIMVSSFDHRQLVQARELDSKVKIGALFFEPPPEDLAAVISMNAYSINLGIWFVDRRLVQEAQAHDLRVFVYTANEPEEIQNMRDMGVDGVFTNYPDRALEGQTADALPIGWN